ncbi:MAG TPA: MqnA/MqnD/SBP family protein, partial [Gemmatimonadales bacterium]|nr:MqnA/MqnD/SBP family protein [Gemmatimonadales bacterium]
MRLGRIAWVNCFPVYGAIDRGVVACPAELVSGTAAELNDLLAAGTLDLSVISAVEYARDAARYQLLPDLAIAADGPVHSVMLFSKVPPEALDGRQVLRTASSRTSVLLLELLCRHVWRVAPRFAQVRAEASDLAALAGFPHDAVLVIGD